MEAPNAIHVCFRLGSTQEVVGSLAELDRFCSLHELRVAARQRVSSDAAVLCMWEEGALVQLSSDAQQPLARVPGNRADVVVFAGGGGGVPETMSVQLVHVGWPDDQHRLYPAVWSAADLIARLDKGSDFVLCWSGGGAFRLPSLEPDCPLRLGEMAKSGYLWVCHRGSVVKIDSTARDKIADAPAEWRLSPHHRGLVLLMPKLDEVSADYEAIGQVVVKEVARKCFSVVQVLRPRLYFDLAEAFSKALLDEGPFDWVCIVSHTTKMEELPHFPAGFSYENSKSDSWWTNLLEALVKKRVMPSVWVLATCNGQKLAKMLMDVGAACCVFADTVLETKHSRTMMEHLFRELANDEPLDSKTLDRAKVSSHAKLIEYKRRQLAVFQELEQCQPGNIQGGSGGLAIPWPDTEFNYFVERVNHFRLSMHQDRLRRCTESERAWMVPGKFELRPCTDQQVYPLSKGWRTLHYCVVVGDIPRLLSDRIQEKEGVCILIRPNQMHLRFATVEDLLNALGVTRKSNSVGSDGRSIGGDTLQ